jgi:hypothetical protein
MKQFFEVYLKNVGNNADESEDAMLSKKPYGGATCASCERKLVNMQGNAVEFNTWSKFPTRDPNDRIARVRFLIKFNIGWTRIFKNARNAQNRAEQRIVLSR